MVGGGGDGEGLGGRVGWGVEEVGGVGGSGVLGGWGRVGSLGEG